MSYPYQLSCAGLEAWGASDRGRVRRKNEDCFGVDLDSCLCVVADGVGGHRAGDVASRTVVDVLMDHVRLGHGGADSIVSQQLPPILNRSAAASALLAGVHRANARILELGASDPLLEGMGTTVVAAIVKDGLLTVAHAGDSRAYLYDGRELRLLTRDDSWLASVLAVDPDPNPGMLEGYPLQNVLTNVVGMRPEIQVHVQDVPLSGGELILLTTDGVHGAIMPERLARIVAERPPAEVPGGLIAAALARGSRDNCTAVVARYAGS